MASLGLLLHLMLLVASADTSYRFDMYYGGSVNFSPKELTNGKYKTEFRLKQTTFLYAVDDPVCRAGDCGTQINKFSVISAQTSDNITWKQYAVTSTRQFGTNLPFEMSLPNWVHWWWGAGFWEENIFGSHLRWKSLLHVDPGIRSDTGESNRSPIFTTPPVLRITRNCPRTFRMALFDPDGDDVRCRVPTDSSSECGMCRLVSGFSFDQRSCSITYNYSSYTGIHPIELVIEDFPTKQINLYYSDESYTTKHPLSLMRHRRQIAYPVTTTVNPIRTTTTTTVNPTRTTTYPTPTASAPATTTTVNPIRTTTTTTVNPTRTTTYPTPTAPAPATTTTVNPTRTTTYPTPTAPAPTTTTTVNPIRTTTTTTVNPTRSTTTTVNPIRTTIYPTPTASAPTTTTTVNPTRSTTTTTVNPTRSTTTTTVNPTRSTTTTVNPIRTTIYPTPTASAPTTTTTVNPTRSTTTTTVNPTRSTTTTTVNPIRTTTTTVNPIRSTTYPTSTTTSSSTMQYRPSIPPLSKLPLDFSVYVDSHHAPSCLDGDYFPVFLAPTPADKAYIPTFLNRPLEIKVRSKAQFTRIHDLLVVGPAGLLKEKVSYDTYILRWTPTSNNLYDYFPICFISEARDQLDQVYHSELRCITIGVGHHEAKVTCNETTISVEVEKDYLVKHNEDILHFNEFTDSSCNLKTLSNASHLVAVMPLGSCGTLVEEDDDSIIFTNVITSADKRKIVSRQHDVEISFSCSFPKRTNLTLGFRHKNPYAFNEKGFGAFTFQFEFFESQRFRKQVDSSSYPVEVYLKQMIFMQIEATSSIPNTELFVESCRATPYDNPNSRISYTIIENGCVKEKTTEIYPSPKSQFRFGMEAFEFIGAHEEVYITCSVLLCDIGFPGTRCSQGCIRSDSGNNRRKRDAPAETSSHSVSQGPLRLVKTSDTKGSGLSVTLSLNQILIVGSVLVLGAIIYRSRRTRTKYQPVPTFETQ